jgi:GT2 family glycosyltransferase|tara:strand:- start:1244 stop:2119 length:876 start_codon:yes stop_codon:yes gene_type:complete
MNNISIIIVNFKSWKPLELCLNSLINQTNINSEIIVVDNHSNDSKINLFKKKYGSVKWIENDKNYGFSKACNIGEIKSKFDILLFLNPDTILKPDSLENIFNKKIDFNKTLISIKQVNNKNKNTYAYGNFLGFLTFNGILRFLYRQLNKKTKKKLDKLNYFYPDWVSGSFIIISKKIFYEIGKWDERFWMYYEDMDLCKRARNIDKNVLMINDLFCYHFHGLSSRIDYETEIKTKTEVLLSKIKYVKKHFIGFNKLLLVYFIYFSILFELLLFSTFSKVKRGILLAFLKRI